jgi:hypothetical protein
MDSMGTYWVGSALIKFYIVNRYAHIMISGSNWRGDGTDRCSV